MRELNLAGVFFQRREVVVPGQLLAEGRYRAAIGTYRDEDKIYSALVGLAELRGNTIKVVPLEGVYIPREGDLVIGTITEVASNNWKVDIGGPYGASLHANNALRRPYDDDLSRYMDIGDVIAAEIIAFDRVTGPFLSMKGRGLRKMEGGMVLEVSPAKIPRIIGRRGSMINMVKDILRIHTVVGQNGRIWMRAPDIPTLRLAIHAFRTIEDQSHTLKLTDRIQAMLHEELMKLKGEDKPPEGAPEVAPEEPVETEDDKPPEEDGQEITSEEKPEDEEMEVKEE